LAAPQYVSHVRTHSLLSRELNDARKRCLFERKQASEAIDPDGGLFNDGRIGRLRHRIGEVPHSFAAQR
jgi:hypothetical protein